MDESEGFEAALKVAAASSIMSLVSGPTFKPLSASMAMGARHARMQELKEDFEDTETVLEVDPSMVPAAARSSVTDAEGFVALDLSAMAPAAAETAFLQALKDQWVAMSTGATAATAPMPAPAPSPITAPAAPAPAAPAPAAPAATRTAEGTSNNGGGRTRTSRGGGGGGGRRRNGRNGRGAV